MIVTVGKNLLAAQLVTDTFCKYLAIGTDSTTPVAGDTALVAEVGTRVECSLSSTSNLITYSGTFPASNPATDQTIKEWGLLSASTAGTLFLRNVDTAGYTKDTADSITIVLEITVA
jgi:hypothetical protein